jgi:outer membrane protein
LQAQKAKSEYQLSIENYQTSKKNVGLAERIEKKQRIKFFEGISSSFDLLQAQNQLYAQQQKYIQSMLDVIATKATLENALNL